LEGALVGSCPQLAGERIDDPRPVADDGADPLGGGQRRAGVRQLVEGAGPGVQQTLDAGGSLLQLGQGARQRRVLTAETDQTSAIAEAVAQDKELTRALLDGINVPVPQGRTVTAYLGLGLSVHLRHGTGPAINGTFVQDALDAITAGLNGTLGAEFGSGRWRFALEGRGVAASGLSTAGLSAGVRYRWVGVR